jgi:3-methylcrotonyl-CoA carboxylase alpha subunit
MFKKILIANRAEIACRVIATARRLGIATVAVYSDADAQAQHTQLADEAIHIGPSQAALSYLNIEAILNAARATGAQAIHPGYGFLSENADFADACAAARITLIGPPASAMRAMGSKAAAKSLMEKAGVPLVPGYHGHAQDIETLTRAAETIGFPVLIKASAGGGGRGMRIVENPAALHANLESAAREAQANFNDPRLLIEKYLTRPRHIEIQIFADTHGNTVSLFERDCSIQRRHQKIIEEAPAPHLPPHRRAQMGQAAIQAARAVGYVGAGTVEFIAENDEFYFMEMNTRLQVEHPVTEMITGQDLVEWQLLVAAGHPLPKTQEELTINGHAIEARLYAEDPARDFLPSIGRITHLRLPTPTQNIRIDAGFRETDTITPYYDAMIAKLIVHAPDRAAALRHLQSALAETEITGVQTNLDLLRAIATEPAFAAAELDTGFIPRHPHILAPATQEPPPPIWAAAALSAAAHRATLHPAPPTDPHSPWAATDSWRLNGAGAQTITLRHGHATRTITLHPNPDGTTTLARDGNTRTATLTPLPDNQARLTLDGAQHTIRTLHQGPTLTIIHQGNNHAFTLIDPLAPPAAAEAAGGKLTAPIPGRITRILATQGDHVPAKTPLIVLEAMKMEITITAPSNGTVDSIPHAVGDMVQEGTELVRFTPEADPAA